VSQDVEIPDDLQWDEADIEAFAPAKIVELHNEQIRNAIAYGRKLEAESPSLKIGK
jgi:hypothetical protein